MSGYQKVYLRVAGLVGDTSGDEDDKPDRVLATGSGSFVPTLPESSGDVQRGPDGLEEIMLPDSVPFTIVDGMVTQGGRPYVWLPVPSGSWMWQIEFNRVQIGSRNWVLKSFSFPLTAATQAQENDPAYVGINLAYYAVGAWSPGEVEALSRRMGDLETAILATQRDAAAATAARYIAEAAARRAEEAAGIPTPLWQEHFFGPILPPGWSIAYDIMGEDAGEFVPPGIRDLWVTGPVVGSSFDLTVDFVRHGPATVGIMVSKSMSETYMQMVTARGPDDEDILQMATELSEPFPGYSSITLSRRGDLWTASADGVQATHWQTGDPLAIEMSLSPESRAYLVATNATITRATYREIP